MKPQPSDDPLFEALVEHLTVMDPIHYLDELGPYEIADRPLAWQRQGLQQTASGYGRKLTSTRVARLTGEKVWRRIYVTQFSNAGSAWVIVKGAHYFLREAD